MKTGEGPYDDFASTCIGQFIKAAYNLKRLHSSLVYLPFVEFEENIQKANTTDWV